MKPTARRLVLGLLALALLVPIGAPARGPAARAAPGAQAGVVPPAPPPGRVQSGPRGSDSYLVWTESGKDSFGGPDVGSSDIYAQDLRTNARITVTDAPGDQRALGISGSIVIWVDSGSGCQACTRDIRGKDLATGMAFDIATGIADQEEAAISGRTVAWIEGTAESQRVLIRDLNGGAPVEIESVNRNQGVTLADPAMSEEYLVWSERVPQTPDHLPGGTRLVVYNRKSYAKQTLIVVAAPYAQSPTYALSGTRLVSSAGTLQYRDLATGESTDLFTRYVDNPRIFGDTVLWNGNNPNDADLWGLKLSDRVALPLVTGQGSQIDPAVAGDLLVWANSGGPQDGRLGSASLAALFAQARARDTAMRPQPPPAPGSNALYFPETQHTLRGRFRAYWEQHGGLAQQGYPLTEEFAEVSDVDGRTYTVQYFERAVFEYHPENAPPYDVLLSLLGTLAYEQKYGFGGLNPGGAPGQRPSKENPRFFAQTGKTLGGVFRAYWESHGGLVQQGYPISDEFAEQSPADGQTYTVQYFQRAVFEWHLENAGTPYEVLLTQLGRAQLAARYGGPGYQPPAPAPPTPTPPPAPRVTTQNLTSVSMVSPDEGWAVGDGGTILHYAGGRWTPVGSPVTDQLTSVSMVSANEGWAVGDAGVILHYTGGQWRAAPRLNHGAQTGIVMVSATDGWIVSRDDGDRILRYSGQQWLRYPVWGTLTSVDMARDGTGWAVGTAILRFDGRDWFGVPKPTFAGMLTGVDTLSADDAWAVDNGTEILHYQNGQWEDIYVNGSPGLNAIRMVSPEEGWAVGGLGAILYYADGRWTRAGSPTTRTLRALDMISPADGWAVGDGGTILHYQRGVWTAYKP